MIDPVISHYYFSKMQHEKRCTVPVFQWLKYVNLTGKYENIKKKYPDPFRCENFTIIN